MIDKMRSQRIINALKNGVVPDTDLDIFCVGREKEVKEFERCLNFTRDGNGIVKFITGTYGTGKSFLLNMVRQKAVSNNFVVAKVQIDKSFKFSKFEEFYSYIMHNLTIVGTDSSGTSFEELFNIWINRLQRDKSTASNNIRHVIEVINNYNSSFAVAFTSYVKAKINGDHELANAVSAWIKGEKNISASLKSKFNIKSNIDKTNALDFLKAFIKLVTLIGYCGLVVTIDEMELVINERADIRRVAYENLRTIIDMSSGGDLNNCMFVFAGTNDLFENDEKGLKSYTALHKRIASIYDSSDNSLRDLRQPIIKITGLGPDNLFQLANIVIDIHKALYDWEPHISQEIIKSFAHNACTRFGSRTSESNIRDYLKKVAEILDIMEQNPGHNLFEDEIKTYNANNPSTHEVDSTATGFLRELLDDDSFNKDKDDDEQISLI